VVLELDAQLAVDDQKQLVGVLMPVPDELALDLDELDLVVVDDGHDLGMPVVGEALELLVEAHRGVHRSPAVLVPGHAWSGWLRGRRRGQ